MISESPSTSFRRESMGLSRSQRRLSISNQAARFRTSAHCNRPPPKPESRESSRREHYADSIASRSRGAS